MTLRDQVLLASRQADQEMPSRLQTNRNVDCFQHTSRVLDLLKGQGLQAAYVGKTQGEGQYHPPSGFPRQVGPWTITGVSHDAIWVEGHQFDLIGGGNDGPEPLGAPGSPTANEIPAEFHRANNPPIAYPLSGVATPVPAPQAPKPPSPKPYPGDRVFETIGAVLEADYHEAGQTLNAGSATWFARTIWRHVNEGMTMEQSTAQSRKEWRAALSLPPV